jgi:RNA 2',3'-cyclic 3'-phosphodiesterase
MTEQATGKTVRSFVAVPLPGQIQADVLAAARKLAPVLPGVKWSRKVENLHITVKFLGQVAEDRLERFGDALGGALVAAALPRLRLAVRGIGAFPAARKASVIWAGVVADGEPADGLARVSEVVETVAGKVGLGVGASEPSRPFRAHVTVGRHRDGVDARAALAAWTDHTFGTVTVDEVHVYESRLGGEGSSYVLRSRALLGQTAFN